MVWRPVLVLAFMGIVAGILAEPQQAVSSVLVAPFAFFVVLFVAAFVAFPVHVVARVVFGGRGTWRRTLHALLWAAIPGAVLGLFATILAVASERVEEDSPASWACLVVLIVLALSGIALQIALPSRFVAMAHSIGGGGGGVSFVSGTLSAAAVLVALAVALARWPAIAFALLAGVFCLASLVALLFIAWLVVAMSWLRTKA